MINEAEESKQEELYGSTSESGKESQSLDSVDDQIDRYIIKYESGSLRDNDEEMVLESLKNRSMRFLLEQEEGEDDKSEEALPTGSEVPKKKPAGVDEKPPLDIDSFTKKVARLTTNYQYLLRIEPVIVNRAAAFLEQNYGKDYVDQMFDILDNQYNLDLEGEADVIDVPIATGAGVKVSAG
jgi:hypothetical protein